MKTTLIFAQGSWPLIQQDIDHMEENVIAGLKGVYDPHFALTRIRENIRVLRQDLAKHTIIDTKNPDGPDAA